MAIHLLGIQQARRKAEKKIVTVYGVVSDRERYQFLRLDSQLSVSISAVMTADTDQNRNEMYVKQCIKYAYKLIRCLDIDFLIISLRLL